MKKLGAFLCATFFLFLASIAASAQAPVPLGTAVNYAVLAGDTITNTGSTTITGNLGLFPGTSVTGGPTVIGTADVNNAAAHQAKDDLHIAWLNATGRGGATILTAGGLNGTILTPGVYKDDGAPASLLLNGILTLDFQGNPNAVFIFQSASTLTVMGGSRVVLINNAGGTGCNVIWAVGSAATIGSGATFIGNILAHDDISVLGSATVAGRLLAGGQANGAGALTLDTNTVTRSLCGAPLTVACPATIAGQVLVAYSSATVGSGGTSSYTFSLASGALPAGLTLNTATGAITGTASAAGLFTFTTGVMDSSGTTATSASCGITILPAAPPPPPPLTLACPATIVRQVGTGYSSALIVTGGTGPYTFSINSGTLPPGLTLNTLTGAITGTPTTVGPFNFTGRVTDSIAATATSASCGITITAPPPPPPPILTLLCAAPTAQVGTLYFSGPPLPGGTPPYGFYISSGTLPPGLTLNASTGAISGTPTVSGQFTFTVIVVDSLGATTVSPSCGIAVSAAPVTPPPLLPDLTIIKSHTGNFLQGGTGSYALTVTNIGAGSTNGTVTAIDTLPAGLTATAIGGAGWTCVLSGLNCTRADALAPGAAYPVITVAVSVANNLINSAPGNGLTFQPGDILLSMKDGTVQWRRRDWTLVKTIAGGDDAQAKGMGFDAVGNLYVTQYYGSGLSGNDVVKFDPNGNLIGLFGSGNDCNPASVVFDNAGNVYVGHADCSGNIFKFNSQGTLLARYDVTIENRGSSHIILAPDQCTMYYTSESANVKRFNVCTNTQMPDFNTAPLPDASQGAQQFSLLPGGGLLVANFSVIAQLDAAGNLVRTYDAPGDTHCWLGMSLDPAGASFWATNWCGSYATRFDIATGSVIESHVASATGFMVKQIIVVPPNLSGTAVVVNIASVSGGGEVNAGNNSASDSTTIVAGQTQSAVQSPLLLIASTAYCIGASWNVGVSNASPNSSVQLMGTTNGQSWMVPEWATTNGSGSFNVGGAFAEGSQGSYTLRIQNAGKMSNSIAFVVLDCKTP